MSECWAAKAEPQHPAFDASNITCSKHLGDPDLAPQTIAQACGLSLRYLHKLFAARLTASANGYAAPPGGRPPAIARPALPPVDRRTGMRWGFADQAQFTRAFASISGARREVRATRAH
jgi:AraC-like DNA-binding protein